MSAAAYILHRTPTFHIGRRHLVVPVQPAVPVRILDRIAALGVQDGGEASDFDLADSKAAQIVMRAVTAYPLNDMQLEQIVKLALGKRILEAATTTADGGPPQAIVQTPRSQRSHHLQTGRHDLRRRVQRGLRPREVRRRPPRSGQSGICQVQR